MIYIVWGHFARTGWTVNYDAERAIMKRTEKKEGTRRRRRRRRTRQGGGRR